MPVHAQVHRDEIYGDLEALHIQCQDQEKLSVSRLVG